MPASDRSQEPAEDTALSFNDGVDAIDNLLDDSGDPKLVEKVEANADAMPDEGADDAQIDGQEPEQDQDGPDEVKSGGKFVSNDAKVTLNDGTVTTVEALKRGFMSQQSFTRSTQEVAAERKALTETKAQIEQTAQALAQQRDFVLSVAQQFIRQPPSRDLLNTDPMGYWQAKEDYDDQVKAMNQLLYQQQSEADRQKGEQSEASKQSRQEQSRLLLEAAPEFRDRKVYDQFWNDATETMASKYGFTPEEIGGTLDHRFYVAMRDLVKYHKALKRAPQVQQEIANRPQVMPGSRRMDPKAKTSREATQRTEQLRKSGSFDAGVAALMDLNL